MSDGPHGYGWWRASDDLWYPPEEHPEYRPPPPPDSFGATPGDPEPVERGVEPEATPRTTAVDPTEPPEPLFRPDTEAQPVPSADPVATETERRAVRRARRRSRRRRRRILTVVAASVAVLLAVVMTAVIAGDDSAPSDDSAPPSPPRVLGEATCDDVLVTFRIATTGEVVSFGWDLSRPLDPADHTIYSTAITEDGSTYEVGVRTLDGLAEGFVYDGTDDSDTVLDATPDSATSARVDVDLDELPRGLDGTRWTATLTENGADIARCPTEGDMGLD